MFRLIMIVSCLAVPAFSYSAGAPTAVCNDLMPQHMVPGQKTAAPYTLAGTNTLLSGDAISISLEGQNFLGFVVQARDAAGKPIGEFKIIDSNASQILNCGGPTTVTHKKLNKPIKRIEFSYRAPKDYKGKIKFVATVAENGGIFWVQKVVKEVLVQ